LLENKIIIIFKYFIIVVVFIITTVLYLDFIKSFSIIVNILKLNGIIYFFISIVCKVYFEQKISLEMSLKPNLILSCLGLLFIILSEIFKIVKKAKQENDLTI